MSGQGSGCGEFGGRGGCGSNPARGIVTRRKCIVLLARCTCDKKILPKMSAQ